MSAMIPSNTQRADATVDWVLKVRSGTRLLFWIVVLSVLAVNSAGFCIPLFGGDLALVEWVGVVPMVAVVGMLIAVLRITCPPPCRANKRHSDVLAQAVRVCTLLAAVVAWGVPIAAFIEIPLRGSVGGGFSLVADGAAAVLLCAYLWSLAVRFEMTSLSRLFCLVGCAFIVSDITSLFGILVENVPGGSSMAYAYALNGSAVLSLGAGACGLVALWVFGTRLGCATAGRCLVCGYLLCGISSPICPECGTPQVVESAGRHER